MRIDKYLSEKFKDLSRSKIQKMIREGAILVNGKNVKVGYEVKEDDNVEVKERSDSPEIAAENIDLEIVFQDENYIVVSKPAGMVVHPGEGGKHFNGTVVNALFSKIEDDDEFRPGVVHRLDKDTSGILLVARNKMAKKFFGDKFKNRQMKKTYFALVVGKFDFEKAVIDSPIIRDERNRKKMSVNKSGKKAVTEFKVLSEFVLDNGQEVSFLEINLKTGRTHQIRVHMASVGHGVVGDEVYGNRNINKYFKEKFSLKRQFLHAFEIVFVDMEGKTQKFQADLPEDLAKVLESLKD